MKSIFILGIVFIISSLVHVVDWTTEEGVRFYKNNQIANAIVCLALSVILIIAHIILFDKVALYYVEEFLK